PAPPPAAVAAVTPAAPRASAPAPMPPAEPVARPVAPARSAEIVSVAAAKPPATALPVAVTPPPPPALLTAPPALAPAAVVVSPPAPPSVGAPPTVTAPPPPSVEPVRPASPPRVVALPPAPAPPVEIASSRPARSARALAARVSYWVQIGAFKSAEAATKFASTVRDPKLTLETGPGLVLRVLVGPFADRIAANSKALELRSVYGYSTQIHEAPRE
ncbi:MAG: SPOR domain-containing protein, partial [Candidatus Rokuibacteriota bacterium]